jgi:hypothetical protein
VSELAEPIEEVRNPNSSLQGFQCAVFPLSKSQVEQPEQQNALAKMPKTSPKPYSLRGKPVSGLKDENWGAQSLASAIYQSEFQYLIAISFLAKLAAIRDVEVWGAARFGS